MNRDDFKLAQQALMSQYLVDAAKSPDAANRLRDLSDWLQKHSEMATFGDFFERYYQLAKSIEERKDTQRDYEELTRIYGPEPTFANLKEWANKHLK